MVKHWARIGLWAWRFAMLASLVTVAFFAWAAVMPFQTVGEPVFDMVILRARQWNGLGFALVQFFGVFLWLLAGLSAGAWRPGLMALGAGLVLFAGLVAMASEYESLIQYDVLRDAEAVARHKLMMSRSITLALAVISLALGWWARPKGIR